MKLLQVFSLPLLTKELIEQAQSKRTYVFRVLYAIVLYGLALLQYQMISGNGLTGVLNMGGGRRLFDTLVALQATMIFLLIPPITCGAVAVEKEKDTLALLLLTKLSPLTIVFEKLLSRVLTMATYQLLSLPLFAIIYGIGGVELADMIIAVCGLGSLTILVASVSILCSTWFRTTSAAFVWTYVLIFSSSFCLAPIARVLIFWAMQRLMFTPVIYTRFSRGSVISDLIHNFFSETFLFVTVLPLLLSLLILFIASRVLVSRAFIPMRNLVLDAFLLADRFFTSLNKATTGGIVLVSDKDPLPLYDSITWRETRKKSLGTFRYQFRILMLLMAPLMVALAAVLTDGRANFEGPVPGFQAFFWIVSIICVTIHATGVIPSERIRQSLDVLLVMPLSPKEIVLEKLSGVRRLIKILLVPFATLLIFQAVWNGYVVASASAVDNSKAVFKLVSMGLTSVIYLNLIMWIGFQLGLRMRTQMQAVLSTFAMIGAFCALPVVFREFLYPLQRLFTPRDVVGSDITYFFGELRWLLFACSPLSMIFGINQLVDGDHDPYSMVTSGPRILATWIVGAIHFAFYAYLIWRVRRNSFQQFSRIVGRTEPPTDKADSIPGSANADQAVMPAQIGEVPY